MATMTSKLPTGERSLVLDADLAVMLERMLVPLSGVKLEKAQAAVLATINNGAQGSFSQLATMFRSAIEDASGSKVPSDDALARLKVGASKLPKGQRPLIGDPDLSRELERMLAPLSGQKLERAQAAIRKVLESGMQGSFDAVVRAYRTAINAATGDKET
jgi:hypothetical protein